jgi:hypothetical protein
MSSKFKTSLLELVFNSKIIFEFPLTHDFCFGVVSQKIYLTIYNAYNYRQMLYQKFFHLPF